MRQVSPTMLRKALYIRQVASRLLAARQITPRTKQTATARSGSEKVSRTTAAAYTLAIAYELINDLQCHFVLGTAHSGRIVRTPPRSSETVRTL